MIVMMHTSDVCTAPTVGKANATFASALQFFAAASCFIKTSDWPPDADLQDGVEFDFIIVGAGTAGSVLANRLSEVADWNILLLEAGGDPPIESDIPRFHSSMYGTKYDWQYKTVNNGRTSQAKKHGTVTWNKGKMLGGSSSINVMMYVQGNPHNFQSWYDEGNLHWHPNITNAYFKKAESLQDPLLLKQPDISNHYGHNGPLSVNTFNSTNIELTNNLLSAWEEIGVKKVDDLNTAGNLGCGKFRVTVSDNKRVSGSVAYLNPIARSRKNLKIGKHSFATKILIDEDLRTRGVEVDRNGDTITLYARKEVVLSAGSINTPQLLMLSGIGPKDHLSSQNISVLVDLPQVGQNLQDHTYVPITVFADGPEEEDEATRQFEVIRYIFERKGYLSNHASASTCAFYASDKNQSYADHQVFVLFYGNAEAIKSLAAGYVQSVESSILDHSINKTLFLFRYVALNPYSRGNISLSSDNPYDYPLIYYDNYSDFRDLDSTVIGIKFLTRIINTEYFRSIGAFLGRIKLCACDSLELDSIEYWKCIASNMADTFWHPVGTAKMGHNITDSVVSDRLKVHGVSRLRVVDASVMPTITSGNPNAPTVMIAERAADLIKEDY